MALKQTLDTLEGVPEALHPEYMKGEDGKFHLNVEGLPEMATALKAANKEAAERRKALEALKGVDPEEYQRLKTEAEERAATDAAAKGQWDKLKEQMAEKHKADLLAKDTALGKYKAQLEKNLIDAQAVAAIAAEKGVPELLLPHVKGRVRVSEVDGEFRFEILDKNGSPMIADASGTPAGFADLVKSMKADPIYGRAFEGSGASGGGAHQTTASPSGQKSMVRGAFDQLNPADQMAFVKSGGVLTD